jgi:Oxidoreductase FAD-binding domain
MRRRVIAHVTTSWRLRSVGGVRYSHQVLEKQLNLKQPHEIPNSNRRQQWKDDGLSWGAKLGFGALSVALLGAIAYEANRYYNLRPSAKRLLDIHNFLPFILTSKEPISANCSIFTLVPVKQQYSVGDPYERLWRSPVWSVQAKQPQLQIARSYTPLPPNKPFDPNHPEASALRLMIREEDRGEMSGYLHRLDIGSNVELRGPQLECQIPSHVDEIVFFAGGTGIAPALQIAHHLGTLAPGSSDTPRMQIIWSSRRREDCKGGVDDTPKASNNRGGWGGMLKSLKSASNAVPGQPQQSQIVQELERVKAQYRGRIQIDYFVDEENKVIDQAAVERYLTTTQPDQELARKAIFVSGPDGFVKYLAGPKEWRNGKELQGPLGGLLKTSVLPHWPVIKL